LAAKHWQQFLDASNASRWIAARLNATSDFRIDLLFTMSNNTRAARPFRIAGKRARKSCHERAARLARNSSHA
jgi:hypothetical protein